MELPRHSGEEKYKEIYFAKIDVDQLSKLSDDLDIQAMPTLVLFKDGVRSEALVDPTPKALIELLDKGL